MFCHDLQTSARVVLRGGVCLHRRRAPQFRPTIVLYSRSTASRSCQQTTFGRVDVFHRAADRRARSFISGVVSDKLFRGHRSPVAMQLYFLARWSLCGGRGDDVVGTASAGWNGRLPELLVLDFGFLTVNATHSLVGTAAPMDIAEENGRLCIRRDRFFPYYGAAVALPLTGKLIDLHGWGMWYP